MEDDYYSIDSILSENQVHCPLPWHARVYPLFAQKIQCTFKVDIPDMGHLDGGHERDVRIEGPVERVAFLPHSRPPTLDRSRPKARSNCHCGLLSSSYTRECVSVLALATKNKICIHFVGTTWISPFLPHSARAYETRSTQKPRASGSQR